MPGPVDTVLVDGYNVLHLWNFFRAMPGEADAKRRRLVAMLENYATLTRQRVIVVFDGDAGGDEEIRSSGVKVLYSRKGTTADTLIEGRLGPTPERTLVVSSDRALAQICRMRGARTRTSEAFEEDLLEFLSRSFARGERDPESAAWFRVGDRLRRDALLTLLTDLKDERARHEKRKMLDEMARLRSERKEKRAREESELESIRRGLPADEVRRGDDEGLRLFHQMYGKKKIKRRRADEPEPPPPAAAEEEGFDWVAAMEATLGGIDPKIRK